MLALALAPIATASLPNDPVDLWRGEITAASLRFGVPDRWIRAVMRRESGGHVERGGRPIRSSKGAIGLMQLMPATWQEMRARLGLGFDPDLPADNILAGTAYLRLLYDQFGYPGLFAAYNAGPARYAAWRERGTPLPAETRAYLGAVLALLGDAPSLVPTSPADVPYPADPPAWRRLFVPLGERRPAESDPQ